MSVRSDLEVKRKKVADLKKKQEKLTLEIKSLNGEISQGEGACTHQWEKNKYDAKLEAMIRICEFCGKVEKARNIQFN